MHQPEQEDGRKRQYAKFNLAYKFDEDRMVYVTYSEGFRPGGVNRRGDFPPYKADYLTNYEAGWKTTWAGGAVRFNGAVFLEEWDDFQYSYLGQNGLTNIRNAGQAADRRRRGLRRLGRDRPVAILGRRDLARSQAHRGFLPGDRRRPLRTPELRAGRHSPACHADLQGKR